MHFFLLFTDGLNTYQMLPMHINLEQRIIMRSLMIHPQQPYQIIQYHSRWSVRRTKNFRRPQQRCPNIQMCPTTTIILTITIIMAALIAATSPTQILVDTKIDPQSRIIIWITKSKITNINKVMAMMMMMTRTIMSMMTMTMNRKRPNIERGNTQIIRIILEH